jgi:hypothetical protein
VILKEGWGVYTVSWVFRLSADLSLTTQEELAADFAIPDSLH